MIFTLSHQLIRGSLLRGTEQIRVVTSITVTCVQRMAAAFIMGALVFHVAADSRAADDAGSPEHAGETRQFTFAWPFKESDEMKPRGGTSTGPDVTLVKEPTDAWKRINEPGLDKVERDRRAILAMAGGYRTSFDFIETAGFTPGYSPSRPYQSWATETIYVIENGDDFISLQHILVMFFEHDDGSVSEPMVVKHWRQDWRYEDRDIRQFLGMKTWEREHLTRRQARGTWSQAVYQVDDSPRYESWGKWVHRDGYSSWESEETWRPLPRREFSVRDDYDVLVGTNRHTITPTGWVHEEDNLKVALSAVAEYRANDPVLAREVGVNRYERIENHDFTAGDQYWQRTRAFWADVRQAWREVYAANDRFKVKSNVDGERLFEAMLDYARDIDSAEAYDGEAGRRFVERTLERFVEPGTN